MIMIYITCLWLAVQDTNYINPRAGAIVTVIVPRGYLHPGMWEHSEEQNIYDLFTGTEGNREFCGPESLMTTDFKRKASEVLVNKCFVI